ncbi:MAG TPA: TetR/AcrR family transcriptional regulator [Polyangia bacterium]|nr:TetR/AcrR family transcriptional regulator [Polyangia bacterium]
MAKARTAPRKLPTQARSRVTIDVILTATARILQRDGFDRASTNRIAEAAGVSIGSLYQYFPSKEALVAALVERHMEQMSRVLVEEMDAVARAPLGTAVRRMVELMLRAHAVDPRLHKVLIEQVPRIGRLERVHQVEAHMAKLVRAYFEAHRHELRPKNLELAAFVVVQIVESLTHAATLHHPERLADGHLADEITTVVLRYLQD